MFHKKVGGPIGLRSLGAIARVVLAMTDRRVKEMMAADNIKTKLDVRYVDDGRTLLHRIKTGWTWSTEKGKMEWDLKQESDDLANTSRRGQDKQDSEDHQGHCQLQQKNAELHGRNV